MVSICVVSPPFQIVTVDFRRLSVPFMEPIMSPGDFIPKCHPNLFVSFLPHAELSGPDLCRSLLPYLPSFTLAVWYILQTGERKIFLKLRLMVWGCCAKPSRVFSWLWWEIRGALLSPGRLLPVAICCMCYLPPPPACLKHHLLLGFLPYNPCSQPPSHVRGAGQGIFPAVAASCLFVDVFTYWPLSFAYW